MSNSRNAHFAIMLRLLPGFLFCLRYLGNEIGNFGARLLAKALQINVSLKTVVLDRNQITGDGYADIAQALKL